VQKYKNEVSNKYREFRYVSLRSWSLEVQIEAEYDPRMSDVEVKDGRGAPLPPFIVMEKGESLSDWTTRSHPDLFQGIAVLVHVATRLRDMHAAGYVHRDIKPGNIMLLPRKNSWTVIDFGCTARTGEHASLSFTVQYAPPEVIDAYMAKQKTIVATEAMDAWAMGVVAFELLTGGSAFSMAGGHKQVRTSSACRLR
jgi:serine/threonine protein kinase